MVERWNSSRGSGMFLLPSVFFFFFFFENTIFLDDVVDPEIADR